MVDCPVCKGEGKPEGCPGCGTFKYNHLASVEETEQVDFKIPQYYRKNQWTNEGMRLGKDQHLNAILSLVDRLVEQTKEEKKIQSSFAIFLPYGHGKKTAMFSIIQNYIQNGYSVAPVMDIASLAILENNFKSNDKKANKLWQELVDSDLVCVYGVDFSARYQTMKLYLNLCSIRGLQDRPTLLFAENSLADLRSQALVDHLSEENNNKDVGCKLSHPYILDGVSSRGNQQ